MCATLFSIYNWRSGRPTQGTLIFRRHMQREFKLKFSALLKAYDGKYTENGKQ